MSLILMKGIGWYDHKGQEIRKEKEECHDIVLAAIILHDLLTAGFEGREKKNGDSLITDPMHPYYVREKIRKMLIADSVISGYVDTRVYTAHISSIEKPAYPAISMFLSRSNAWFNVPAMVNMEFQLDFFFPSDLYSEDDVFTAFSRVRSILNVQQIRDADIGVTIAQIIEGGPGPMMYENETR